MSVKKPLVFLGLFIFMALFYYYYEYRGGKERQELEDQEKQVLAFTADSVDSFTIARLAPDSTSYERISLAADSGLWRITSPVAAPADSEAVARLLRGAAEAKLNQVVEDSAKDLSMFGLDPPRLTLEVKPRGASTPLALQIGNKNPTGSYLYAASSGNPRRVVLINSWLSSDLDKSVYDLRDKRVFHCAKEEVRKLAVETARGLSLDLEKEGDTWSLKAPLACPADQDSAGGLIDKLTQAEAAGFVDTLTPGGLKAYGLDSPGMTVKLFRREEGSLCVLHLGALRDSVYYAQREGEKNVLLVKKELLDELTRDWQALRDKSLVSAGKEAITGFTLTTPGEKISVEKGKENSWALTAPDSARADGPAVDGFLWDLKDLKARRFVSKPGQAVLRALERPFLSLSYRTSGGTGGLEFVRPAQSDRDSMVYVRVQGWPDMAAVDSARALSLVKSFQDLQYKKVLEFDSGTISRIRLEYQSDTLDLFRKDEKWHLKAAENPEAKDWKVQNLLWDLSGMDFTRIVSQTGADSAGFGFTRPAARVTLWQADTVLVRVSFADSVPGAEQVYLRRSGDERTFEVKKQLLQGLPANSQDLKMD